MLTHNFGQLPLVSVPCICTVESRHNSGRKRVKPGSAPKSFWRRRLAEGLLGIRARVAQERLWSTYRNYHNGLHERNVEFAKHTGPGSLHVSASASHAGGPSLGSPSGAGDLTPAGLPSS